MKNDLIRPFLSLGLAFLLAGCDHSFEAIEKSDLHFSIVGYLDASADTQWIRVMPLREQVGFTSAEPLDATVTLENLDDGSAIVLRDSVFVHPPSAFLQSGDTTYIHNFWTARRITHGDSYRLVVRRGDGATSAGTVSIPEDYGFIVEHNPVEPRIVIEVAVKNLSLAQFLFETPDDCLQLPYVYAYPFEIPPPVGGVYRVPVLDSSVIASPVPPCARLRSASYFIVASDLENWPEGPDAAAWAFPILNGPTRFTNAEGFFAGVVSKRPLLEKCVLQPAGPCRIRYDSRSSVLTGRILDGLCGGLAYHHRNFAGGTVVLRDIPASPSAPVRVRSVDVDTLTGIYRFDGLDPGARYAVRASHLGVAVVQGAYVPVWGAVEDTVVFGVAETVTRDYALPKLIQTCVILPG